MEHVEWWPEPGNPGVVGRFFRKKVANEAASKATGELVLKDVIVLEIKMQGMGDVHVKEVKEHNTAELSRRFPQAWEAFKSNYAIEQDGTPLTDIPLLYPETAIHLSLAGINNVEQLAEISDTVAGRIPNGRALRKAAQDFLTPKAAPVSTRVKTRRKKEAAHDAA